MKLFHDFNTDVPRGDFVHVVLVELGNNGFYSFIDGRHSYRSLLTRFDQTLADLLTIKAFALTVLLDDPELGPLDCFIGGVAVVTAETNPAPTDARAVL